MLLLAITCKILQSGFMFSFVYFKSFFFFNITQCFYCFIICKCRIRNAAISNKVLCLTLIVYVLVIVCFIFQTVAK